jgi:hypothetical protein
MNKAESGADDAQTAEPSGRDPKLQLGSGMASWQIFSSTNEIENQPEKTTAEFAKFGLRLRAAPHRGYRGLFLAGWRKCDGRGNYVRGENPAFRPG